MLPVGAKKEESFSTDHGCHVFPKPFLNCSCFLFEVYIEMERQRRVGARVLKHSCFSAWRVVL